MRYHHNRSYDNSDNNSSSFSEYPCAGFWGLQILGGILIFFLGMRFAVRRTPLLPIVLYRLLRGTANN